MNRRLPQGENLERLLAKQFAKCNQEALDFCISRLHINADKLTMRVRPRHVEHDDLLPTQLCENPFAIAVNRDPCTGDIISYNEILNNSETGSAKDSLLLTRTPGDPDVGVLGSTTNLPFFPGGMEDVLDSVLKENAAKAEVEGQIIDFENDLLKTPTGFEKGFDFADRMLPKRTEESEVIENTQPEFSLEENFDILSIMNLISGGGSIDISVDHKQEPVTSTTNTDAKAEISPETVNNLSLPMDNIVSKPLPITNKTVKTVEKHEFAEIIDVNQPVKDFELKVPVLVHQYPFELDIFQKQAIIHLEKGDSIFVAAHTSAGKTAVAEYGIALCKKHMTKAVYTSPIKALSNQKFHDFKQTFGEVGLITGDIQINTNAFCLIMTTEILRLMLYNGSDTIREVEWVIFDEVHYINDSERGVVWEEVLIMLPRHVKIIMLSATVPNSAAFADWVGRIKNRTIYVISTPKRPVPLEHYLYTGKDGKSKDNRFLLVDKTGNILTDGYNKALSSQKDSKPTSGPKVKQGYANPKTDKNIYVTLIDHLTKKDLLPAIVFVFSRRKCDANAAMLTSLDMTTNAEKSEVHFFFSRIFDRLKGSDRKLPQVLQMQDLCKRGLAVHHAGILPILKEAVEMLFQQGFVKVLFATETFAMGINMPARTVVFDSTLKHDGFSRRDLKPGEYTQMAGRAGRRGKDKIGTVIVLCKGDVPELSDLNRMILGKADILVSKFRITYSLILNSLRVAQIRIEEILERSFAESLSFRERANRTQRLESHKKKLDCIEAVVCSTCSDLPNYYSVCKEIVALRQSLIPIVLNNSELSKKITPGRILLVSIRALRNCPAVLLRTSNDKKSMEVMVPDVVVDEQAVKIDEDEMRFLDLSLLRNRVAQLTDVDTKYQVVTVNAEHVCGISTSTLKISPDSILNDWRIRQQPRSKTSNLDRSVILALQELRRLVLNSPDGIPLVDITSDVTYQTIDAATTSKTLKRLMENLSNFECVHCLSFQEHMKQHHENFQLNVDYQRLVYELSPASLTLMPLYEQKLMVLKQLNYVDPNNMMRLKGNVACCMSVYELLITELIVGNVLSPLSPPEIAAVLSCATCEVSKKDVDKITLPENLEKLRETILETASNICQVQMHYVRESDYEVMDNLQFDMMEVVYEWAQGTPFVKIMEITELQEGLIVRRIQRLDEVCRDVRNAARIVGEPPLQEKLEKTSAIIKRDIVFAASLYTTM